ncbi:MAG: sulfonate transport system substrate-binding protein [Phycisphaerales bacterium]|jgi:NitT/TauT family transport system substrate-binding protein|nr:sulfonate transport system substrate-binding protein [Phycisphaerales bacterium]
MKTPFPHRNGLFALSLLVAGVCGCDRSESSGDAGGGPASPPPAEVRLGYFGNVTHAQAALGVASGDFANAVAPSKFSTKVFNAGPSLIEALFSNNIDIGYVGPGPTLSAHQKSRGEGIRVVAGAAANGVLIVARKGSGITTLSDLAGKKIGTPQTGNTQDIAARWYLTKKLGQKDANNVIAIANAEQQAMMSRGEIDAAWAPEPWGSRLIIENGATLIAKENEAIWPSKQFVLTVVVTTPEFLQKHPDVVKKVLGVHATWTHRLQQDPQAYAGQLGEALFNLSGKKLPPGVLDASLKNVQFTVDPLDETFQTMAQWAYDVGFAKEPAKLDGLIDTTLLQQVKGTGADNQPTTKP